MTRFVIGGFVVLLGVLVGYMTRSTLATSASQRGGTAEAVGHVTSHRAEAPPSSPQEDQPVLTLEGPVAAPPPTAPPREAAAKAGGAVPIRARPSRSASLRPAPAAMSRPPAEPSVSPDPVAPVVSPPPVSTSIADPAAAVAAEPADVPITRSVMDRGRQLLSGEEGRFPMIVAHYRDSVGFHGYARAVRRFGGRFFVRDLDAGVLRAEIDVAGGRLLPIDTSKLAGLSPLSRDLSDEPALSRFTWDAERAHGRARYAVLLLVPASIDAAMLGAVDAALRAAARTPHEFVVVEGEYHQRGGDFVLEFRSAHGRSGEALPLRAAVNLSRIP